MKKHIPWFTLIIVLVLLIDYFAFYLYNSSPSTEANQEIYSDFGAPYAIQIYQGQYWGLFFNRFLHTNPLLLFINSVIFLFLGYHLQKSITWFYFLFLLLFSTVFTSLIQLTLSNDAGIGFASINFFFFTYLFAKSIVSKTNLIPIKHILGLFSVLLLIYLNYINQFSNQFGIEGMIAGWVSGFALGILANFKKLQVSFSLLILAITSLTIFYSPWSAEWNYSQGYKFHIQNDFTKAKISYKKVLTIDPKHQATKENLTIIQIEELKEKALFAHEHGDFLNARELYTEILKIDPDNLWVKENLSKLP